MSISHLESIVFSYSLVTTLKSLPSDCWRIFCSSTLFASRQADNEFGARADQPFLSVGCYLK
ncbi:unnamed protein product [Moneuplotes crassus]|uniref:Uncharacterized protein n=1 Tax=Euplotes crassus TaxID=5936 RepID=A0AAD2D979_EUPCR|nr:unnamed protein product [Moneuplotes crassus]